METNIKVRPSDEEESEKEDLLQKIKATERVALKIFSIRRLCSSPRELLRIR